jgi:quercetin dioxygenase-like cupin family protein
MSQDNRENKNMDRATFETALIRDGFQMVSVSMKPEAVNASHVHDFEARLLVVEGAMTIDREGAPVKTYQAGETFEMPLGCRHSETAGSAGATYVAGRRKPS